VIDSLIPYVPETKLNRAQNLLANLVRDADILQQARQEAFALVKQDPQLKTPMHRALRETMLRRWETKLDLGSVS